MFSRAILRVVIYSILLLMVACQSATEPNPRTHELLLPLEQLPSSWEESSPPRQMGPHVGFGDDDDFYVNYKRSDNKYNIASHYVLYFPSVKEAESEYLAMLRVRFNDNSIAINEPWQTPPELSYTTLGADQFHMACTINNVGANTRVCEAMGQYGQYITIFHSGIGHDMLSLREFNDIVQYLDESMMRELNYHQSK